MNNKLFVGNLDWGITDEDLGKIFSQYGEVEEAVVITERGSTRSRGFGFVTMKTEEGAKKAMEELDGTEHEGRELRVNVAKPKSE